MIPSRVRTGRGAAVAVSFALFASLVAGCTIETAEDSADETLVPTTTVPVTTTISTEEQLPPLGSLDLDLVELARYDRELSLVGTRSGSESIFVGDHRGRIFEIKRDVRRNVEAGTITYTPRVQTSSFLDLSARTESEQDDQGLHGFAFSTDGGRLYVSYTNLDGDTQIDEFRMSGSRISPTSQRELLIVGQQDTTQNAGPLLVGPDGFLHIAFGDGGGANDPLGNGQNAQTLLGSIARIDPEAGEGVPYNIPLGNPYDGDNGAAENYLIGVRHPSSLTYDPETRDLWITDVGQGGMQEVNLIAWESEPAPGANLGWPILNGDEPLGGDARPVGYLAPVLAFTTEPGCDIVGGAVYRGKAIPALVGAYIFGDRCTGRLRAIRVEDGEPIEDAPLSIDVGPDKLSAIGTTPDGELVVVTTEGLVEQVIEVIPQGEAAAAGGAAGGGQPG